MIISSSIQRFEPTNQRYAEIWKTPIEYFLSLYYLWDSLRFWGKIKTSMKGNTHEEFDQNLNTTSVFPGASKYALTLSLPYGLKNKAQGHEAVFSGLQLEVNFSWWITSLFPSHFLLFIFFPILKSWAPWGKTIKSKQE